MIEESWRLAAAHYAQRLAGQVVQWHVLPSKCTPASQLGKEIPESGLRLLPSDLMGIVQKQNRIAHVPIQERVLADVETEVISAGPFGNESILSPCCARNDRGIHPFS